MIDVETLRRGPQELVDHHPVFTDRQVQVALRTSLSAAREVTERIAGIRSYPACNFPLFSIEAGELVFIGHGAVKYQKGKLQETGFEALRRFGMDPDITEPYRDRHGRVRESIEEIFDGTVNETLSYPSQTIPGLSFLRSRQYYPNTGETINVAWYAQASPKPFSAHFRR